MSWFLGVDTSNYTTSVAAWNKNTNEIVQIKKMLPVAEGKLGLRQSEAVFAHTKQLGTLIEELIRQVGTLSAVGVAVRPRDETGSYMPCFLVGKLVAQSLSAVLKIPMKKFSHQAGHIASVIYAIQKPEFLSKPMIAFHVSGGTTESVLVSLDKGRLYTDIISSTLDLFAGQAIDRIGNLLGLGFPAGIKLEKLAIKSRKNYKTKPFFKHNNPSISGLENICKKMYDNRPVH